jgi:hypothetical protein
VSPRKQLTTGLLPGRPAAGARPGVRIAATSSGKQQDDDLTPTTQYGVDPGMALQAVTLAALVAFPG